MWGFFYFGINAYRYSALVLVNPNVVKVDASGLITPMGIGDAVITISSPESDNCFAAQGCLQLSLIRLQER